MELVEDSGGWKGLVEIKANVSLLNLIVPDIERQEDELVSMDKKYRSKLN